MLSQEIANPNAIHDENLAFQWPKEKAANWYAENGWAVGCNYVPSDAINQLEMWQEESFNPSLIDKELSWAAGLGFNTVRVFLHNLLWNQDPEGYLERIDQYLSIAYKHGIRTMLVLFDSVWNPNPKLGVQPQPKHNVHNSGWVQCPGYDVLNNPLSYDELESYVKGIVAHFKNDERVLIWDLYNEPDNMNITSYVDDYYVTHKAELALALLKKTISWVRSINPMQPITMAPWKEDWTDRKISVLDNYMFSHSDIVSFHCYEDKEEMEKRIKILQRFGRPMMCTEYMARTMDNTFHEILPLLRRYNVGAYNWGFVAGKSQTHCPWDSWQKTYNDEPELWFHDIFRTDGTPYIQAEVDFLREFITKEKSSAVQHLKVA
ncbi:MAG: 1,4-beta-xylanase [Chitinophagaceae bacterium]